MANVWAVVFVLLVLLVGVLWLCVVLVREERAHAQRRQQEQRERLAELPWAKKR